MGQRASRPQGSSTSSQPQEPRGGHGQFPRTHSGTLTELTGRDSLAAFFDAWC